MTATLTHQALQAWSPLSRGAGEELQPIQIKPLSRNAGEGAERSEAGEGGAAARSRQLPSFR
jgi:hypothetical protein